MTFYSLSQEEPLALLGVAPTPVLGVLSAGLVTAALLLAVTLRSSAVFSVLLPNSALFSILYKKTLSHRVPGLKTDRTPVDLPAKRVEMVPNQVMGEMVLDGGGQFIPAGIFGLNTLSLLLAPLVAHDRATEHTHTHTGKERKTTRLVHQTQEKLTRGYSK